MTAVQFGAVVLAHGAWVPGDAVVIVDAVPIVARSVVRNGAGALSWQNDPLAAAAAAAAAAGVADGKAVAAAGVAAAAIPRATLQADGDILIRSGGVVSRLPIGANGHQLTVDGGTGLPKWAAPAVAAAPLLVHSAAGDGGGGAMLTLHAGLFEQDHSPRGGELEIYAKCATADINWTAWAIVTPGAELLGYSKTADNGGKGWLRFMARLGANAWGADGISFSIGSGGNGNLVDLHYFVGGAYVASDLGVPTN